MENTIPAGADFDYVNGQSDFRRLARRLDTIGSFVRNTAACSVVSNMITIPVAASNNDVEVIDSRNTKFIPANSLVTSLGVFFTENVATSAGTLAVGFGNASGDASIVASTVLNGAGDNFNINSFTSTSSKHKVEPSGNAIEFAAGSELWFANTSSLWFQSIVATGALDTPVDVKIIMEYLAVSNV